MSDLRELRAEISVVQAVRNKRKVTLNHLMITIVLALHIKISDATTSCLHYGAYDIIYKNSICRDRLSTRRGMILLIMLEQSPG